MTASVSSQSGTGAPSGATEARARAEEWVGRTLASRYRLDAVIGVGGMGAVYRAERVDLGTTVAVKVLNASGDDPGVRARFRREARHLGALSHPHCVRLFDVGETETTGAGGSRSFLVMEWVDGVALSALSEPLAIERIARIGAQVAGAMAQAHAGGMVHRDLKPANVMISEVDGRDFARVLDFGVAKVLGRSTDLTARGALVGTPQYMAPEQVRGEVAGPAADVYAFGVLLYELVAGRPPFDGAEAFAVGYKHLHETPLPPGVARPLPEALEQLILECLAKDVAARPASMETCRARLESLLETRSALDEGAPGPERRAGHHAQPRLDETPRDTWLRPSPWLAVLCAIALAALAFVAGRWTAQDGEAPPSYTDTPATVSDGPSPRAGSPERPPGVASPDVRATAGHAAGAVPVTETEQAHPATPSLSEPAAEAPAGTGEASSTRAPEESSIAARRERRAEPEPVDLGVGSERDAEDTAATEGPVDEARQRTRALLERFQRPPGEGSGDAP